MLENLFFERDSNSTHKESYSFPTLFSFSAYVPAFNVSALGQHFADIEFLLRIIESKYNVYLYNTMHTSKKHGLFVTKGVLLQSA